MRLRRKPKPVVSADQAAVAGSFLLALAVVALVVKLVRHRAAERARATEFALHDDAKLDDELRRVAREQVDGAIENLARGNGSVSTEAVHDTRKRMRHMRTLLRLSRKRIGAQAFESEIGAVRSIGRRLGAARDAHVTISTLDSLVERYGDEIPPGSFDGLRAALEADARTEHERLTLKSSAVTGIAGDLRLLRARIAGWPLPHGGDASDLRGGLRYVHKRARRAYKTARKSPTTENLHQLRRRSKDLRHAAAFTAGGSEDARELAHKAHRLTDLLGDEHDLDVLREVARGHAEALAPDRLKLLEALIERRRSKLREKAMKLAGEIYALKPSEVAAHLDG